MSGKADYLAFGAFNISNTKRTKHKANLTLLKNDKKNYKNSNCSNWWY